MKRRRENSNDKIQKPIRKPKDKNLKTNVWDKTIKVICLITFIFNFG